MKLSSYSNENFDRAKTLAVQLGEQRGYGGFGYTKEDYLRAEEVLRAEPLAGYSAREWAELGLKPVW